MDVPTQKAFSGINPAILLYGKMKKIYLDRFYVFLSEI